MTKKKVISSLSALGVCILLTLLLLFENNASAAAKEALSLAFSSVLPSLFPYMVVSSVIISLDLLEPIYSLIPTEKLFGLPRFSAQVLLCGLLCGFPVGAMGSARLYSDGKISKSGAATLCAVSSHTSPAFLVGAVSGWWNSPAFGIFLYVMQIIFAVFAGIVLRRALPKNCSSAPVIQDEKKSFSQVLCQGISDASLSCLSITGYIVFFRVLAVLLSSVVPLLSPLFLTVLEFSTGAFFGGAVGGITGISVTGFAVGFSGLAVFMQCINFTGKYGIPMKRYLIVKLSEGLFLAAVSAIFALIHPLNPSLTAFVPVAALSIPKTISALIALLVSYFVSSFRRKRNNFPHRY